MSKVLTWLKWFFSIKGNVGRSQFWKTYLIVAIGGTVILNVVLTVFGAGIPLTYIDYAPENVDTSANSALYANISLLVFMLHLCCAPLLMRRYRDAGLNPGWVSGYYVPMLILMGFINVDATVNSPLGRYVLVLGLPGLVVMVGATIATLVILFKASKNTAVAK